MRGVTNALMLYRSALEALLAIETTSFRETVDDGRIRRRKHEETEPREHAFLLQTVPPIDPLVKAIERRRSGFLGDDEDDRS